MTIRTSDGICERIVHMIKTADDTGHFDLSQRIHNLACQRMTLTRESYSEAVRQIIQSDPTIARAYRAYGHHNGAMTMLPLRDHDTKRHTVDEMVVLKARDLMARTGIRSLAEAAKQVLAEDPQLAAAYSRHTSA